MKFNDFNEGSYRALLKISLFFFVAFPYSNSFTNGFVWVDTFEIFEGGLIINSWQEFKEVVFVNDLNSINYHRPLYNIIHSIDFYLWGNNSFGYHLSSLVLHLLNVFLLFVIVGKIYKNTIYAYIVALIWGILPCNVSAVSLIHSKADLLATFFLLSAFSISFDIVKREVKFSSLKNLKFVLGILFFILALLSKETSLVFPLVLIILFYYENHEVHKKRSGILISLFLIFAFAYILFRFFINSFDISLQGQFSLPFEDRVLTFIPVYVDYIFKTFSSYELTENDSILIWKFYNPIIYIIYVLIFVLLIWIQNAFIKFKRPIWYGFLWFNIYLIPVCQIVPVQHFRADRFLYLPSIGLVIALVGIAMITYKWLCQNYLEYNKKITMFFYSLTVIVILGFSIRIWYQNKKFSSDLTLFYDVIENHNTCREAHSYLARLFLLKGEMQKAGQFFKSSFTKNEKYYSYIDLNSNLNNYALFMMRTGHIKEAYNLYKKLLRDGNVLKTVSYLNFGICCKKLGNLEEAARNFENHLTYQGNDSDALYLLGEVSYQLNNKETCLTSLNKYLKLNPNASDRDQVLHMMDQFDK